MVTIARKARAEHLCQACGGRIHRSEIHWEVEVVNRKPSVRIHRECYRTPAAEDALQATRALYTAQDALRN